MVDHRFSARALSKLSPTPPVEGAMPASSSRWVNRIEVYWQPLSLLNRIRFNSDYAEVCVKPRMCGDGLCSWGVLADFSA